MSYRFIFERGWHHSQGVNYDAAQKVTIIAGNELEARAKAHETLNHPAENTRGNYFYRLKTAEELPPEPIPVEPPASATRVRQGYQLWKGTTGRIRSV